MDALSWPPREYSEPARHFGGHRGGTRDRRPFCRAGFLAVVWQREFGAAREKGRVAPRREGFVRGNNPGGSEEILRWSCGNAQRALRRDRKSTRLNSSHLTQSRM